MNLVIFGPPGAGKGTQSKYIVKKYNLYQLSTGELLRNEIKNKTELGLKISSIIIPSEIFFLIVSFNSFIFIEIYVLLYHENYM